MRAVPLVVAVLCCLAPLAAATAPLSPPDGPNSGVDAAAAPGSVPVQPSVASPETAAISEHENRSRVMRIPSAAVQRSEVRRVTVAVGPAASVADNATETRIETRSLLARIDAADNETARADQLRAAFDRTSDRADELVAAEQAALAAYNRDAIDTRTFVVRLTEIHLRASLLRERLRTLEDRSRAAEGVDLERRSSPELRFELRTLGGPVRDRVGTTVAGNDDPVTVFVETGPEGISLATVDGETYVRETIRGAARDDGGEGFDTADALNVTAESYPIIWETATDPGVRGSGGVFEVTAPHDGGELVAFVDGGSGQVFKEFQRLSLSALPNDSVATNTRSNLRLEVQRSYPGGPVRINVTDRDTGEPVDARITINLGPARTLIVGQTGADGSLWTLSPRGEFEVTAIKTTRVVIVRTNATAPPELG